MESGFWNQAAWLISMASIDHQLFAARPAGPGASVIRRFLIRHSYVG
jgi:hypothetical protein